jgi:hypothetical protein
MVSCLKRYDWLAQPSLDLVAIVLASDWAQKLFNQTMI